MCINMVKCLWYIIFHTKNILSICTSLNDGESIIYHELYQGTSILYQQWLWFREDNAHIHNDCRHEGKLRTLKWGELQLSRHGCPQAQVLGVHAGLTQLYIANHCSHAVMDLWCNNIYNYLHLSTAAARCGSRGPRLWYRLWAAEGDIRAEPPGVRYLDIFVDISIISTISTAHLASELYSVTQTDHPDKVSLDRFDA